MSQGESQTPIPQPKNAAEVPAVNATAAAASNSLSLTKLAASRHRSSFAQRFFRDLVAGRVDPYRENGPHNVSVLQDERGSAASRSGLVSSASWRPKHQLRSASSPQHNPARLKLRVPCAQLTATAAY